MTRPSPSASSFALKRASDPYQPWWVLAGSRAPIFDGELSLRWFQIKYWLTGHRSMTEAFENSALLYGAQYLRRQFEEYDDCSAAWRMRDLLRSPHHKAVYNHCFKNGELYKLSNIPSIEREVEDRDHRRPYDRYWIEHAIARLQLIKWENDPRKESAEILVRYKAVENAYRNTTAEKDKSIVANIAYVLAAHYTIPSLLDFTYKGSSLIDTLDSEIVDSDTFGHYCMMVRAISHQLRVDGDDFIGSCIQLAACELPELDAIPQEVLDDLPSRVRRPASQTKRRVRQQSMG